MSYTDLIDLPKGFYFRKSLYEAGSLYTYEPRNPLPAFWWLGEPYLRYSNVDTTEKCKLMALGIAVSKIGVGQMEAFYHFNRPVVWLSAWVVNEYLVLVDNQESFGIMGS